MNTGRVAACALAWLLCLVPLMLPATSVDGTSRFALCALIWAAVLGVPFVTRSAERGRAPERGRAMAPWTAAAGTLALSAPPLALALLLEGRGPFVVFDSGRPAFTLGLLAALALAAELAARRGARAYACFWGVFVVGAPLLNAALATGGDGTPPVWLERVAAASPLAWIAASSANLAWGPVVVVLVAIFSSVAVGRSEP